MNWREKGCKADLQMNGHMTLLHSTSLFLKEDTEEEKERLQAQQCLLQPHVLYGDILVLLTVHSLSISLCHIDGRHPRCSHIHPETYHSIPSLTEKFRSLRCARRNAKC